MPPSPSSLLPLVLLLLWATGDGVVGMVVGGVVTWPCRRRWCWAVVAAVAVSAAATAAIGVGVGGRRAAVDGGGGGSCLHCI